MSLEDGGGSFKVKPDNLAVAPPCLGSDSIGSGVPRNQQPGHKLQQHIQALPQRDDDMWVFCCAGYTKEEHSNHMGVILIKKMAQYWAHSNLHTLHPTWPNI